MERNEIEEKMLSIHLKGEIIERKRGTYGIVFIVEQQASPKYIAYKTTKDEFDKNKLDAFIRETKVWFNVKGHILILTPFYITNIGNKPLICMPFCEKTLRDYLNDHESLKPVEALVITSQILKGLIFARGKSIESHQDLKPENILLEDLSKKFAGWPRQNVDQSLKWRVRIGDFGSANAWRELGKPYGTKPYMAPEQWKMKSELEKKGEIKEKIDFSKVDVFAVGVILYELLTGKHPIGVKTSDVWPEPKKGFPQKYKHDRVWKKWSEKASEDIKLKNIELKEEIENLIKNMLLSDINERLDLHSAFKRVMDLLHKLHDPTEKQLELLFEYYDCWVNYSAEYGRLRSLIQLSQLHGQKKIIIEQLLKEIKDMEKCITSPADAVYFCELCYTAAKLLLSERSKENNDKAKILANMILKTATRWRDKIKTYHRYPELKFKDQTLVKTPPFRDFEIYTEIIRHVRKILEEITGKEKTRILFENVDNYTKSAYFYSIASDYHSKGDKIKATEILEKCIELNPKEAVFYYMKGLWLMHYVTKMEALWKIESKKRKLLKKSIIANARKATELAPDWKEAKEFLEKLLRGDNP